jgi:hypothetical protein
MSAEAIGRVGDAFSAILMAAERYDLINDIAEHCPIIQLCRWQLYGTLRGQQIAPTPRAGTLPGALIAIAMPKTSN